MFEPVFEKNPGLMESLNNLAPRAAKVHMNEVRMSFVGGKPGFSEKQRQPSFGTVHVSGIVE